MSEQMQILIKMIGENPEFGGITVFLLFGSVLFLFRKIKPKIKIWGEIVITFGNKPKNYE